MTVATRLTFRIGLVDEATPENGGLRIRFRDGSSAFLDASHPRFADRKSTRLNSSHQIISYAVFCLKKKKNSRRHVDSKHGRANQVLTCYSTTSANQPATRDAAYDRACDTGGRANLRQLRTTPGVTV